MSELRARVSQGRLLLDEPTDLPEGTVIDLVADDEGDDLSAEERKALDGAIERAWGEIMNGEGVSAEGVVSDLRSRR